MVRVECWVLIQYNERVLHTQRGLPMDTCDATTSLVPCPSLEALEHQITELAAHIHAANYRLLCLIAEFDRREGWFQWGIQSCAHWLNCHVDQDRDQDRRHRSGGGP